MQRTIVLLLLAFASQNALALTAQQWLADLDVLARDLPARHVAPYAVTPKAQFDAAVEQLRADIPTLEDSAITVRIMQLVALIGDSHTSLFGVSFTRFPIEIYWLADGWFVTRATPAHADLLGCRITSIDDRPIDDAIAAIGSLIPHENEWWLRERAPLLLRAEVLRALGIAPSFSFQCGTESIERVLVEAAPDDAFITNGAPPPLPLQRAERNYWYEYLNGPRILYVKYNAAQDQAPQSVAAFTNEVRGLLQTLPVDKLVFDLRHNTGGASSLFEPMINAVAAMPSINQPGRLFVVTGRATFSSALLNVIVFHQRTNATFIGEPTGGKPNHRGEVRQFTLPNSGLVVTYSTRAFVVLPGDDSPSFAPDVLIVPMSAEYFSGRDAVVDLLRGARGKKRAAQHP